MYLKVTFLELQEILVIIILYAPVELFFLPKDSSCGKRKIGLSFNVHVLVIDGVEEL